MSSRYHRQLRLLSRSEALPLLQRLKRGIEKESLRITPAGTLAQTSHPPALGSALTHPLITTDFSEALLEFITPVHNSVEDTLAHLDRIHRYSYRHIGDEILWVASMPCQLGRDEDIPVALYGTSNSARMKSLYRVGLGYRYGRRMQTIAGIHYNFSIPDALWPLLAEGRTVDQDYVTERYFGLIRNFRRWSWLLLYLFSASPAMCKSFLDGLPHQLEEFDPGTLYLPYATSLRMGDLGYQSSAQEQLDICYNSLENYVQTLKRGILQPHPDYERIGINVDGEYRQLSTSLLQIENEFYSVIRPKRVSQAGETPLTALAHRGTEYIEVRCLDLNPFEPLGLSAGTARFMDAFLLYCLLADSPLCDDAMRQEIRSNHHRVVNRGREPGLQLDDSGCQRTLQEWGSALITAIHGCAELLDRAMGGNAYRTACAEQQQLLDDPERTPSARVLATMREQEIPFGRLGLQESQRHAADFRARPLPPEEEREMAEQAATSLADQRALEAKAEDSFEMYLEQYFEQYRTL